MTTQDLKDLKSQDLSLIDELEVITEQVEDDTSNIGKDTPIDPSEQITQLQ